MATLPESVKRWLDGGASVELVVVDLARVVVRTSVVAEYDGDDLLMAVPEGGAVHHALIYDPQATVLITALTAAGVPRGSKVEVRGEVEMTTAGAAELRVRTDGTVEPGAAWLVVRVIPTAVEMRDGSAGGAAPSGS